MTDIFNEAIARQTAKGELFEFAEKMHSDGITYREFINPAIPENLRKFFDFGLFHPEKDWLVYEDERYTYKQIFDKAAQLANALMDAGIKKGDRVAICMVNCPEYIIALMGILGMGAVAVPLNSWWVPREVIYGLDHSDAKLVFADEKRLRGLDNLDVIKVSVRDGSNQYESFEDFITNFSSEWPEVEISKHDNATIFYTSGSTGHPKGVLCTHRNMISGFFSWACISRIRVELFDDGLDPSKELSILHCVPLFHVTGSHVGFFMSVLVGRKIVMMKKWDPTLALELLEKEKITNITGVPTQTWELLNHPNLKDYDLSALEDLAGGGAARPPEHVKKLDEAFEARPSIGYGLTETNAMGCIHGGDEYIQYPASCGRVVPPLTDIKIIDEHKNKVPEGEVGEIVIKSPANMVGYWKNDAATKEVIDEDGWFRSGDLGYFDGPFLHIVDRVKDLVIRGGENISCIEVESAIYEHNAVSEVCVFGIPEERLGEKLCAAIVLKDNTEVSQQDLELFLSERLAAFKIPSLIKFQNDPLPRVASGKFSKTQLRDDFKEYENSL